MYEGHNWRYINIPADKIKPFMIKSLENNKAMYFSCDVGKQLNRDKGILALDNYDYEDLLNVKFGMDKKARIITHQSGSSHGMAIVGADTDKNNKITKWLVENSWGASSGHNGYLIMTDEWFDNYMFRIVIPKKYLSKKILDKLNQKRIKLPPWDPMFEYDN
jgi:bleomycin hydrolase